MSDDNAMPDASTIILPVKAPERVGPVGVGGWLFFFALSTAVLGPMLTLGIDYKGWASIGKAVALFPGFAMPSNILLAYDVVISLYGIVVGKIIFSGSANGARRAREYLWARLALGTLALGIAGFLYSRISPAVAAAVTPEIFKSGVQLVLSSALWICYFAVSKRVQNTYG
jgi:Protein of unknown function (DUF2569)